MRLLALLLLLLTSTIAQAQAVGVVMLHGKWAKPPYWHAVVTRAIEHEGWPVIEPVMPWADGRNYDEAYPAALKQIAEAEAKLRAQGVKRVIIAGHSFGANAAIAYVASGAHPDGILLMAPGHTPAKQYERGLTRDAVDQARRLVAEGKGGERIDFIDVNQGKRRSMSARAEVFLSYFDPDGLADMPTSMGRIDKALPIFWLVGTGDPLYEAGREFAFDEAPPHPLSRYEVVAADHVGTPSAGLQKIIEWLKAVAAQP